jgi:hypothetical protein
MSTAIGLTIVLMGVVTGGWGLAALAVALDRREVWPTRRAGLSIGVAALAVGCVLIYLGGLT